MLVELDEQELLSRSWWHLTACEVAGMCRLVDPNGMAQAWRFIFCKDIYQYRMSYLCRS